MPMARPRSWRPATPRCNGCGAEVRTVRTADAVAVDDGFMPNVPGAICPACLPLAEGLVVNDLRDEAAGHLLRTASFESSTPDAVQSFLDLHGWQPAVIAGGAMRLHLDGREGDAYALLDAAAEARPEQAGWFRVEAAGLLVLDGSVGKALDLLEASNPADHPCWHLHHGLLAKSLGRTDAAEECWRSQIAAEPGEPLGWKLLAWHLLQDADHPAAAEEILRTACDQFPDDAEFRAWLAHACYRLDRKGDALRELETGRRLEPADPDVVAEMDAFAARIRQELTSEA